MNEHKYHFVEPGRDRRQRSELLKAILKRPAGAERAVQLAQLARTFHDGRDINLALDTAQQSLADAEGDITPLVAAYARRDRPDLRIEELAMLASLGRWLEHPELAAHVHDVAYAEALAWCASTDGRERERRLELLRRRFDDALADRVDLALR